MWAILVIVFDRFTEPARRTIFFARYEASVHPTSLIEPEHLLLGILREFTELRRRLPVEDFRKEIAKKFPGESISTSVDLPLNNVCKAALARAAKEADRLSHEKIDCGHLALGLMLESPAVSEMLYRSGVSTDAVEWMIENPAPEPELLDPQVESNALVRRLKHLFRTAQSQLLRFSEPEAEASVGQKKWSRKETLGHLVDCATTHLHWIARALTEPKPAFSGPVQDEWAAAIGYKTFPWRELVPLWVSLNLLLAHVIAAIPEEKTGVMCRIGIAPAAPLSAILERYMQHCEELIAEILTLGHS